MSTEVSTPPPAPAAFDPYAAPAASVADVVVDAGPTRHYVVSSTKFWCLYLGTLGIYGIYWVYRHWSAIKVATKGDEWPVMRAIFSVFFMHSLTAEIDQSLVRARSKHEWNPQVLATVVVVAIIASRVLDRMADPDAWGMVDTLSVLTVPLIGFCKWRIQLAANEACGDPTGAGNANFTVGNLVWLGFGALFWLLIIASAVILTTMGEPL